MTNDKPFTLGIDASNIRSGGGVTHLVELLRAARPEMHSIECIVVWGGTTTLIALEDRPWLAKRNPPSLDKGLLQRTLWQRYRLSQAAHDEGCDVLFVPGGSYAGNFHPVVTMSQNLLPFKLRELRRYGWTLFTLKLLLLRLTQSRSFKSTDGVIFLTKYARDAVLKVTGKLRGQTCIVPHGLNPRFNRVPKPQRAIVDYDDDAHPYRVLYVSIIDLYKHQWHVAEAVAQLRSAGIPIELELIGPPGAGMKQLKETLNRVDPRATFITYRGAVPYERLDEYYGNADIGVFASSCENMPNILIEGMAAGLPMACSRMGPMPEVLGDAGGYFDPEDSSSIANVLRELIESPDLRAMMAHTAFDRAQAFSWSRCANETFGFFTTVMQKQKRNY